MQSQKTPAPSCRLVAAGVKRGTGPLVIEQPEQFPPLPVDPAARRRAIAVRGW